MATKLSACFLIIICCCVIRLPIQLSCNTPPDAVCQVAPNPVRFTHPQHAALISPQPGAGPQLAPHPVQSPSSGHAAPDESWRSRPPAPRPAGPLKLPPIRQSRLDNGLTIVVVEDHRAPIVTIDIAVPIGEVNDPARQTGLAEATAELLSEGAGSLGSKELAR